MTMKGFAAWYAVYGPPGRHADKWYFHDVVIGGSYDGERKRFDGMESRGTIMVMTKPEPLGYIYTGKGELPAPTTLLDHTELYRCRFMRPCMDAAVVCFWVGEGTPEEVFRERVGEIISVCS